MPAAGGHAAPAAVGVADVTATATGTAATGPRTAAGAGRGAREPAAGHVSERFVVRVGVPVVRVVLVHAAVLVVVRRRSGRRRGRHRVGRRRRPVRQPTVGRGPRRRPYGGDRSPGAFSVATAFHRLRRQSLLRLEQFVQDAHAPGHRFVQVDGHQLTALVQEQQPDVRLGRQTPDDVPAQFQHAR